MKTANGNENQPIESMRKYENPSNQKFKKSACIDLGNRCSIHLSYGDFIDFEWVVIDEPFAGIGRGPTQFIGQVFHTNTGRRQVCLRERPQMQKAARARSEPADPRNGHGGKLI